MKSLGAVFKAIQNHRKRPPATKYATRITTSSCTRKMGPAYIDRRAKQATKLDITNMMSARRRSRQPTAFHRLAALLSVPLTVRVLVFGVVVVVITSVPAPVYNIRTTYVRIRIQCSVRLYLYMIPVSFSQLHSTYLLVHCSTFRFPLPPQYSIHQSCCNCSLACPRARPCSRPTSTSVTKTSAVNRSTARDQQRSNEVHPFLRPAINAANLHYTMYITYSSLFVYVCILLVQNLISKKPKNMHLYCKDTYYDIYFFE